MKRHLLILFAALLPLLASAHDFEVDGIYYNITSSTGHTVEVTYKGDSVWKYDEYSGSITLPATVTYDGKEYSVTSIGDFAFYYCSSLTAITIPEGVTSIGRDAFDGCSSLTSMVVAEGNTIYDSRNNCNAIIETSSNTLTHGCSATIIPEGVTSIRREAFSYCSKLTSITIPESVTSIGSVAFSGCSSLTSMVVAEGNTIYDSRNNCNAIIETSSNTLIAGCSSTIIPESVTSIGQDAFINCTKVRLLS